MGDQGLHQIYLQNAFFNGREKNMPPSYLELDYNLDF